MPREHPTLIAINPVIADRADDFAEWLRTVLFPAARAHRPDTNGRCDVLRATEAENGAVIFTFLFYGLEPSDWQMEPILEKALGAEAAQQALTDMTAMLKAGQYGWSLSPVELAS